MSLAPKRALAHSDEQVEMRARGPLDMPITQISRDADLCLWVCLCFLAPLPGMELSRPHFITFCKEHVTFRCVHWNIRDREALLCPEIFTACPPTLGPSGPTYTLCKGWVGTGRGQGGGAPGPTPAPIRIALLSHALCIGFPSVRALSGNRSHPMI